MNQSWKQHHKQQHKSAVKEVGPLGFGPIGHVKPNYAQSRLSSADHRLIRPPDYLHRRLSSHDQDWNDVYTDQVCPPPWR